MLTSHILKYTSEELAKIFHTKTSEIYYIATKKSFKFIKESRIKYYDIDDFFKYFFEREYSKFAFVRAHGLESEWHALSYQKEIIIHENQLLNKLKNKKINFLQIGDVVDL